MQRISINHSAKFQVLSKRRRPSKSGGGNTKKARHAWFENRDAKGGKGSK